jgi:hypothetical protein
MDWLYGSRAGSGKQDDFLLCFYEKISSRLLGQFCCFDMDLTDIFELSSRQPG